MRCRVLRYLLPALLAAFSAIPAAADPITVGEFFFVRDLACDPNDSSCVAFEYFNLSNTVDVTAPSLAGLTFSAVIQIDAVDYEEQFFPLPIAFGESASTLGLPATPPFLGGGRASLVFSGNFALYGGTLSLSNLLYDDLDSPSFSAAVEFIEDGPVPVTESPSWLVAVIALSALAVGRALFS